MKMYKGTVSVVAMTVLAVVMPFAVGQSKPDTAATTVDSSAETLGVELLTDKDGANPGQYLLGVTRPTKIAWMRVLPSSARAPLSKRGKVTIELALFSDGSVKDMTLMHGSGESALDHAAWAAIIDSSPYPSFPKNLTVPEMKLRFQFSYNEQNHAGID